MKRKIKQQQNQRRRQQRESWELGWELDKRKQVANLAFRKIIITTYCFLEFLKDTGKPANIETFKNDFGYQGEDAESMYNAVSSRLDMIDTLLYGC